jgi:predicted transcriptional regulator
MEEQRKSKFLVVVGDSPAAKILDFLAGTNNRECGLTKIMRGAKVTYQSARHSISDLKNNGIVVEVGQSKRKKYRLNEGNSAVKHLFEFYSILQTASQVEKLPVSTEEDEGQTECDTARE